LSYTGGGKGKEKGAWGVQGTSEKGRGGGGDKPIYKQNCRKGSLLKKGPGVKNLWNGRDGSAGRWNWLED